MSWLGKILGGLFGLKVFGPFGAILGIYLGHLVDRQETYGSMPRMEKAKFRFQKVASLQERNAVFFSCVFSMLAKLARADGAISADEIEVVERFMQNDLNLDPQRQKMAKNIFRAARESDKSFTAYAKDFHQTFQGDRTMLENLLDILLRLSLADGKIVQAEEELLRDAARIFGLGGFAFERMRSTHSAVPNREYAILGCSPDASPAEIKRRYRTLVKENHPDALRAMGQPEEFAKISAQKFREIQEAYESIKERKGFS